MDDTQKIINAIGEDVSIFIKKMSLWFTSKTDYGLDSYNVLLI
jgi:hypothetical protein